MISGDFAPIGAIDGAAHFMIATRANDVAELIALHVYREGTIENTHRPGMASAMTIAP